VDGQLNVPAALPREKGFTTHLLWVWVRPRASVNALEKRKISRNCLILITILGCPAPPRVAAIHSSVICQTTGPQSLPKRFLHLMKSRASSFKWEYPLLSPRSSSNFLRHLPRRLVTSLRPCIFPSITSFRRHFLRKIWPIQLALHFLISCRIILCSLTHIYMKNTQCKWRLRSPGLQQRGYWKVATKVSENVYVSILYLEKECSISSYRLVTTYQTTTCHNPEVRNLTTLTNSGAPHSLRFPTPLSLNQSRVLPRSLHTALHSLSVTQMGQLLMM
jgi:hypothetical protein